MTTTSGQAVFFLAVLAMGVVNLEATVEIPSFIKVCSRNDPHLNACVKKNAESAIPKIANGLPDFKVPNLNPLFLKEIKIKSPGGLAINLKDVNLLGLAQTIIKDVRMDTKKKTLQLEAVVPLVNMQGQYDVDGKILVVSIKGSGPMNITLVDLNLKLLTDYDLKKKDDGKEYISPKACKLEYGVSRVHFQLDNLFKGDKELGETTNALLNDNWESVSKDVGPPIARALAEVYVEILRNLFAVKSYDEILPEKV